MKLAINRCQTHGHWSVSIDDDCGGLRITPAKCCGRWNVIKTFELSAAGWREIALHATRAADDSEREEDSEE